MLALGARAVVPLIVTRDDVMVGFDPERLEEVIAGMKDRSPSGG